MPTDDNKTYTYETFELISMQLTDQYESVFCEQCEDGKYRLVGRPCDAIGIASVKTHEVVKGNPRPNPIVENRVVALTLYGEGSFDIDNSLDNFSGIAKAGENLSQCHDCLNFKYHKLMDEQDEPQACD